MPPHPIQLSRKLWTRHVPNTNPLIPIMRSKSSFYYLTNSILFCNSQNLYLVIVSDDCSLLALLPAIHHFLWFVLAGFMSVNEREYSLWYTHVLWLLNWFDSLCFQIACWIAQEQGQMQLNEPVVHPVSIGCQCFRALIVLIAQPLTQLPGRNGGRHCVVY